MFLVSPVTAGTRIHRGYEHEPGWKRYSQMRSGYGDLAVFDRLPKNFQDILSEFGHFIEKENAIVGQ
jgi:hypothetical protein